MKKLIVLLLTTAFCSFIFSQGVGLGTLTPNASSILDIQSTSKGVLLPRMTTIQRNAIATPANGLMILNLDDQCLDIYDGTNWIKNCGFKITGTDTMPTGAWTQKQNFGGSARMGAVGFSIGTKGYMGTGWDGTAKSDFWEYDPATNSWSQKASMPYGRAYGVGMAIQTSVNGPIKGYIGLGSYAPGENDWWEYDVTNNTWTQKATFPGEGRSHAVGFSQSYLGYVGTGITSANAWLSNFYSYNPANDQWTLAPFAFPYATHSAVAFNANGNIIVGSGWNFSLVCCFYFVNNVENSFFRLQNLSTWTAVPDLPGDPRQNAVAFAIGNYGYVGTGSDENGVPKNDMWRYDVLSDTWTQSPNFAGSARHLAVGMAIGNKGYVGTGNDGANKQDFWEYNPSPLGNVYTTPALPAPTVSFNNGSWTKEDNKVYNSNTGNVGIGTSNPTTKLEVAGSFKVSGTVAAPLKFENTVANRKLVLWEGANNDHQFFGLGINGSVLRYQVNSTADNHIFYAATGTSSSNELMRIQGNGNIGIGVSSPANKVDVNNGAARTGTHPSGLPLYVTGAFGAGSNGVEFRHDNGTQGIGFGFNTVYATGSNVIQDLGFAAKGSSGNLIFSTNATERMRINGAGNIGVGTTIPNAPLQFSNALQNRKIVLYESGNNDHQYYGLGINGSTFRYQVSTTGDNHVFYAGTSSSSSTELMRIQGNGNVGLGNSNPAERLHIGTYSNSANTYLNISTTGGNLYKAGIKLRHFSDNWGWTLESDEIQTKFLIKRHLNDMAGVTTFAIDGFNGNISLEGTIQSEPFIAPTLINGFTNYGNGFSTAAYFKDKLGQVHLRGLVNNAGSPVGLILFTLPAGYRPSTSGTLIFMTGNNNNMCRIDISVDGNVIATTGSAGWICLDGIAFRAD
jgi:hypothetical protein